MQKMFKIFLRKHNFTAKIFTTVRGPCKNYFTGIFLTKMYETKKKANYGNVMHLFVWLINPRRMRSEGYGSCPMSVRVCVCLFVVFCHHVHVDPEI